VMTTKTQSAPTPKVPAKIGAAAAAVTPSAPAVLWRPEPQEHDYPAAASYLSLLASGAAVSALVAALKKTSVVSIKSKDLLRASRLPLLPAGNVHVASDLRKIAAGVSLSPCLLVRGELRSGVPLQIADGYHRVCAVYLTDENADVHVKIVKAR
jgi:hypothetical protein